MKSTLQTAVILAFAGAIGCAAQTGAPESFTRALQLQSAGDFEGAIRAYREVLASDPSNFSALANLGAALAHQGEYSEAIAEYKAALQSAPEAAVPPIRMNIALALYKSGQIPDAAREFAGVARLQPSQTNAVLLEADCYLRLGDFERVIGLLAPFETDAAENRAVEYMLGMAYIRSGRPEKGQPLVDRLIRGGESAETHYLLGSVAFMAQDFPAAVKEFGEAVRLDAALPALQSYYGRALLFSGDPEAAESAFRRQLAEDSTDYDANLQLAEILRYRKDTASAEPLYRKAQALRPGSVEARYGLAACRIASADFAEARAMLEQIVRDSPGFADAHRSLARVYASLRMKAEAERESAIAAKLAPGEAQPGIPAGSQAPDFALLSVSGEARTRLSSFRGVRPAVVVFGSYTCPKFRSQVDALNRIYERYRDRAGFLLVYIREAHGASSWQSTANQREGIDLPDAANLKQKREYAAMCVAKLKIRYPAVVDGMDNGAEKQWSAFPSRVYVIDRAGKIVFNSILDRQQFDAAALVSALESALR